MHNVVEGKLPISVKCRIGLYGTNNNTPFMCEIYNKQTEKEEFDKLLRFIDTVASYGTVTSFIIHARSQCCR
jgi:tRNA-dihydrouridine synthase